MHFFTYLLQCLSLLLLVLSSSISALPRPINHKLHTKKISDTAKNTQNNNNEFKILYYDQTLDHFNYQLESYKTFKQKYVINYEHWGGAKSKSPILVYLGAESSLDNYTLNGLILKNYGQHFKALLLFIEHRFYGESIPFGMSKEKVMKNTRIRGYFNSAQALADYAQLILHVKQKLNAHFSPVIVVGGSYGGMLATWFRLKYPHVALGALASSAPILYFDNIIPPNHGYYSVVTKDFKETSESCFEIIRDSWMMIDKVGQEPNGLSILTEKFNTCDHLNNTGELKDYLEDLFSVVAQYNLPPITSICNAIDNGSHGTDILSRIYAAIVAFSGNLTTCQDINLEKSNFKDTILGWDWQICSEMVMPMVFGTSKDSMFPHETFNLTNYIKECKDIVLETLSDSLIAVYTINGTHTMDILKPEEDDPEWLVHQRKREVEIIDGWLRQYYGNLKQDVN
ncbi:hypothetical protein KSS87_009795 [Heliosperma pusillum]|nr:hypothetical protein KSS87_009795 [Heliosperma pusillum]